MDAETLSRIQFALTAGFHFIFPPLSIGLGIILVIMEWMWLRTNDPLWGRITRFWVLVFGLTFGMGVATGIVLEFQFGTNWPRYSEMVGDVFGSALAAEGIFAFFLESGFLAIVVFGWDRVSRKVHFFSTCMVSLGSMFSAIWIIVANSWQQTPAGHHLVTRTFPNGETMQRAEIVDFWAMVFNPSSMDRLTHTVVGAFLTGAFLVVSISAYYLLKKRHAQFAVRSIKVGLGVALVASLLQVWLGHQSAVGVHANQPSKFAAMEGHYKTGTPADLVVAGFPSDTASDVVGLKVPGGASALLFGSFDTPVTGLDSFEPRDRPNVAMTFGAFHTMVGLGTLMVLLAIAGFVQTMRGKIRQSTLLLKALVVAVVLPQMANMLGWATAEVGRQPWVVWGLLRTQDALTPTVDATEVTISLVMFTLLYGLLFVLFLFLLDRKIKAGPDVPDEEDALLDERRKAGVIAAQVKP